MSHVHHFAAACPFKVDTHRAIAAWRAFSKTVLERVQLKETRKVREAQDRAEKDEQEVKDLHEKLDSKRRYAAVSQAKVSSH